MQAFHHIVCLSQCCYAKYLKPTLQQYCRCISQLACILSAAIARATVPPAALHKQGGSVAYAVHAAAAATAVTAEVPLTMLSHVTHTAAVQQQRTAAGESRRQQQQQQQQWKQQL
jgi:hypothetical protein